MADNVRAKYEDYSIEEIVQACIDRGILVDPEMLDNRDALLDLLHHDVNDFYARERVTENQLLRAPPQHKGEDVRGAPHSSSDLGITGNSTTSKSTERAHNNSAESQREASDQGHRPAMKKENLPSIDALAELTAIEQRPQRSAEELRKEHKERVKIVKSYTKPARKRSYDHFVKYFNKRYQALSGILKARKELQNVVSIGRCQGKQERETVAIIGMVFERKESKSKHIILTLEDPTGTIEVWLSNSKRELLETAREIVLDEVIGIVGKTAGSRIFADSVIFPDVSLSKELKKSPQDKCAVFVGDVHVGAKLFLKDEFEKFLLWLSGNVGTPEQRDIARRTEYIIFTGDVVEGIGIYPDQDQDLNILDLKEQYAAFTRYIKMIPEEKHVVITVGNHDVGRLQEPQLPIPSDFAPELCELPNVTLVSNPAYFTIDASPTHPGFDVLIYHGYSLIYYANTVQPIRDAGGQKATEKIMKLLLQKRHLAPTHGCNTYVPDPEEDPMVIDRVPDFLVTGHIHRISYANYRGVTVMNAGCWSEVSEEQEKRGLEPQPAKLPIVNLRTRELRIMNFYHNSEAKKQQMQQEGSAAAATDKPAEKTAEKPTDAKPAEQPADGQAPPALAPGAAGQKPLESKPAAANPAAEPKAAS